MTALYSILHFLVDGVCAFAMFGYFATQENWYLNMLLYNFFAFAMQMPLGVVLDGLNQDKKLQKYQPSFAFAVLGVVLTLVGALAHPIVLGLGNALFHLGGGVGTIHEDKAMGWRGRGLGVFVAPGALGLYIGTQLAKSSMEPKWTWMMVAGVVMLLCLVCGARILRQSLVVRTRGVAAIGQVRKDVNRKQELAEVKTAKNTGCSMQETADAPWEQDTTVRPRNYIWALVMACLTVVILRSYIGMAVSFSWKTSLFAGTTAVLAVVLGKVAGGFASAGFGIRRTAVVSLGLAAVCFLFSNHMPAGVAALFFFNMTMPITLYLLVKKLEGLPGFAFGLLTFGLFLGFLPVYFGVRLPLSGCVIGCVGSLVSLLILWLCVRPPDEAVLQSIEKETQEVG